MKLSCVRLNKDVYIYAAGKSFSGTIEGPAEVIGPWVKVTIANNLGKPQDILIWGAHTLPSELASESGDTDKVFETSRTLDLDGILGGK